MNFMGMEIISHPLLPEIRPKLQLSHKVVVSDEFRASMDKWLLDMFGTERVVYVIAGKTIMANHKNVAMIRGLL